MQIVKSVVAVALSVAAAIFLFMVIEGVGSILHPWPENFAGTFDEISHQVETYPVWVLALLGGVGYGATMWICSFIATRIGHNRNPWHGYGVGVVLFSGVVLNMTQLPYPIWFWVLMFVVLPPAAYCGAKFASVSR